jgi:hypothetical protein
MACDLANREGAVLGTSETAPARGHAEALKWRGAVTAPVGTNQFTLEGHDNVMILKAHQGNSLAYTLDRLVAGGSQFFRDLRGGPRWSRAGAATLQAPAPIDVSRCVAMCRLGIRTATGNPNSIDVSRCVAMCQRLGNNVKG